VRSVGELKLDDCNEIETRFLATKSYFAATAVLRADAGATVLEFHNPHMARTVETGAGPLPLAADYSAPLARSLDEAPRTYFAGFVQPGTTETAARLSLLEPYQPGKIPVVLIHGLFSDPLSWADLVNDLRATPGFAEQYQVWYFRYPTGQGFLQSAATLRRELRECLQALDPDRRDGALRQVVLVGHSMGGLIAKLQVTHSEEHVWSRLANRPLAEIVATEEARALLAEACYFEPSPDVARVIFIASPHSGSLATSGLVGRGASLLVEPAPATAAIHDQLVRDNPGVFNPEFEERLPTSIDMLQPRSPLLSAMQHMPIRPGVRLHNILGVSHPVSLDGPSDGVVSVYSASHPGCQSVHAVGAKHARVHRTVEASAEVLRILMPLSFARPVP
jgi:pimeloyl-ACP methyl ester carboxylesterase